MILNFLNKHKDVGLLILRLGFGAMFIYHGLPKMLGGSQSWEHLGTAMANFGITFLPSFWGFMAAFSELVGGICIILGFFFRPACFLLAFTMATGAFMHLAAGDGLLRASHAIEDGIVFFSLIFIGPGKYSVDARLKHYLIHRKSALGRHISKAIELLEANEDD
jgi:putative oxidoreductase